MQYNSLKNDAILTQCGTHVQAVARLLGNPVLVDADELLDEIE
jgi:hypothetical protein